MPIEQSSSLISIVMPVWNGAAYVAESLQSIVQQAVNYEIIVVDDGSTDSSRDIAATFPCRVLAMAHAGIAKTCNTGIQHAKGAYIMILDQDDLLCAESLPKLLNAFTEDNSLQVVTGKAQDFISPDCNSQDKACLKIRTSPYYGLMSGCMLMRRDVVDIVGKFNESYRAGQAVDYLMRIMQSGINCHKLNFISAMRRLHANNTSRTMKDKQFSDYGAILRAKLTR